MPQQIEPIFSPPSPGEILKIYILGKIGRRVTQDELARAMNMSRLSVNEILNGKRPITPKTALKLGRVLGTSPELWLNLQRQVDLFSARQELAAELDRLPVLRQAQVAE
jgi:addiction module HigA family antidote